MTTRMALFYFTYFAGLGVTLPYFNLYFERMGLDSVQIGVLSAIVPLGKVLVPVAWAYRADRWGGRRRLTIASCLLTVGALALFLPADSFAELVLASLALAMVDGPRLPLADATALDVSRERGVPYGRMRGWGSVGFIISAALLGRLLGAWPVRIVLHAAVAWAALNWMASLALPEGPPAPRGPRASLRAVAGRPAVLAFLAGSFLMQAGHGGYYAFFSIHLDRRGYAEGAIGALWALAVAAEVAVMFRPERLLTGRRLRRMMAVCALLACARWGLLAASAAPAAVAAAQVLHAATFGAFHLAAVQWIHRAFPPGLRASGQSLHGGVTYALGAVLGSFGAGLVFDAAGPRLMFAASAIAALGSAALLTLSRRLDQDEEDA